MLRQILASSAVWCLSLTVYLIDHTLFSTLPQISSGR